MRKYVPTKWPVKVGTTSNLFPDNKSREEKWEIIKTKMPEIIPLLKSFNVSEVQVK